jgi:hypothetical protein
MLRYRVCVGEVGPKEVSTDMCEPDHGLILMIWPSSGTHDSGKVPPTVWGDRCYQVGTDSPPRVKDGMPVHVRIRTQ